MSSSWKMLITWKKSLIAFLPLKSIAMSKRQSITLYAKRIANLAIHRDCDWAANTLLFPLPRTKSTSQDEKEDDDGCDMAKEMKRAGKKQQQQRDGEEWREEKRGEFETCRRALKNVSHNYILLRTNWEHHREQKGETSSEEISFSLHIIVHTTAQNWERYSKTKASTRN